ncbi:MAG: ABC transporter permease, partial [Promethearchaeota archaeon]
WRFPYFKDITKVEYFTQMMKRSLTFQSVLFQLLFIESFILAAITQFICILVSTLRMEREVGIIRSLGLDKKGVLTIFLAESTALGITAAFLGLVDGLLGAHLLGWYISLSIPIRIELTLNYVILWIFFSILVTQISAFIPSYRSSRRNIVAAISGRPLTRELRDSYKIRDFLKDNSSQLQVSFFFLLGVFTCVYIFNNSLKIIGLVPLDLIVIFPVFVVNLELFIDIFTELNLFSIVLGLTSLAPLSYLIAHEKFPKSFGKELFKSLLFGLVGIVIAICSLMILLLINISIVNFLSIELVLTKINENLDWLTANIIVILIQGFIIISFLGIFSLELLVFHRVWVFLVIRGMIQSQSFKEQILLTIREGSRGQFTMIVLFLIHLALQFILINFNRVVENISNDPYILFRNPLLILLQSTMFLMTAIIDIGFFIFLVTLPVFIFKNQIRSNLENLSEFN